MNPLSQRLFTLLTLWVGVCLAAPTPAGAMNCPKWLASFGRFLAGQDPLADATLLRVAKQVERTKRHWAGKKQGLIVELTTRGNALADEMAADLLDHGRRLVAEGEAEGDPLKTARGQVALEHGADGSKLRWVFERKFSAILFNAEDAFLHGRYFDPHAELKFVGPESYLETSLVKAAVNDRMVRHWKAESEKFLARSRAEVEPKLADWVTQIHASAREVLREGAMEGTQGNRMWNAMTALKIVDAAYLREIALGKIYLGAKLVAAGKPAEAAVHLKPIEYGDLLVLDGFVNARRASSVEELSPYFNDIYRAALVEQFEAVKIGIPGAYRELAEKFRDTEKKDGKKALEARFCAEAAEEVASRILPEQIKAEDHPVIKERLEASSHFGWSIRKTLGDLTRPEALLADPSFQEIFARRTNAYFDLQDARLRQQIRPIIQAAAQKLGNEMRAYASTLAISGRRSGDLMKIVKAADLRARAHDDRALEWIYTANFEGELEEARKNFSTDQAILERVANYGLKEFWADKNEKRAIEDYSAAANEVFDSLTRQLASKRELQPGEVRILVTDRHDDTWSFLQMGPVPEEERAWVDHFFRDANAPGFLMRGDTQCMRFACNSVRRDRESYSVVLTYAELKAIFARASALKLGVKSEEDRQRYLEHGAGENEGGRGEDYLALGFMGFFKNEQQRVAIPTALMPTPRRVGKPESENVRPAEKSPSDVIVIDGQPSATADGILFIGE